MLCAVRHPRSYSAVIALAVLTKAFVSVSANQDIVEISPHGSLQGDEKQGRSSLIRKEAATDEEDTTTTTTAAADATTTTTTAAAADTTTTTTTTAAATTTTTTAEAAATTTTTAAADDTTTTTTTEAAATTTTTTADAAATTTTTEAIDGAVDEDGDTSASDDGEGDEDDDNTTVTHAAKPDTSESAPEDIETPSGHEDPALVKGPPPAGDNATKHPVRPMDLLCVPAAMPAGAMATCPSDFNCMRWMQEKHGDDFDMAVHRAQCCCTRNKADDSVPGCWFCGCQKECGKACPAAADSNLCAR